MSDFKIFVNFKTYPQAAGEKAVALAKVCQAAAEESGLEIIPIVQVADLCPVKKAVKIPVWVQHIDPQPPGKFTGWINLETVMEEGASGALISHSEHQIPPGTIKQIISRIVNCKLKISEACLALAPQIENFESMVCCKTLGQIERLVKLKPDFIGYEISELIGGEVSITDESPKSIGHAVEICGPIPVIVGAGVHKPEDLKKAKELGAKGVLISSAVVLAEDPKEALLRLLKLLM